VPRYLWRQALTDGIAALRAATTGDQAQRFASALRIIWFAGYLRESWCARVVTPAPALSAVEGS